MCQQASAHQFKTRAFEHKFYTFQFKEFYFHIFIISGSEETKRGCEKINEIRIEKGFQPLDIHLIKLVDDSCHDLGPIFL